MIHIITSQLKVIPGNVRDNFRHIAEDIAFARACRADVLVLPELCLSGYLIGDLWDQPAFLRECESYGRKIAALAQDLTIIFGNVAVDWKHTNDDGRPRKYNAAFAASKGAFLHPEASPFPFAIKTLLPNYRQFDDRRYFTSLIAAASERGTAAEALTSPFVLQIGGKTLRAGVLLCEDSWDENYRAKPMAALAEKRSDILFNLSASPFTLGKDDKRHRLFTAACRRLKTPMVYVNQRGLQNNGKDCYTFDGMTAAYSAEGTLLYEAEPFTEGRSSFHFDPSCRRLNPDDRKAPARRDMLLPVMRYGVSEFLSSIGAGKVVIGVSGGIDSAVAAALYQSVLPEGHVLLVNTPTRYNSATTKNLAAALAQNLAAPYLTLPIGSFIDDTASALDGLSFSTKEGTTTLSLSSFMKENIQARDRSARVLAALSASFGGIFTCNANKTELSVGYATLYGDMAGALAATADLWKHQVYALGRALNAWYGRPVIPEGIFTVKPSAELSDSQAVDKGLGDPLIYDYHDYLLQSFVEPWERSTPEDILSWYRGGTLEEHIGTPLSVASLFPTVEAFISDLERWWRLFAGFAVAKRIQSAPLIAVSRRPFGYDLRESQLAPYYTDRYLALKKELLEK